MSKKIVLLIILIFGFQIFGQNKKVDEESTSPFFKALNDSSSNFKPQYKGDNNPYSTINNSKTSVHYNTDIGSSKYDKSIRWGIDINEKNVQKSLNEYRERKRTEEIIFYLKIFLSLIGFVFLAIVLYKVVKRKFPVE